LGRLTVSDLPSKHVRVVELHDEFVDGDDAALLRETRTGFDQDQDLVVDLTSTRVIDEQVIAALLLVQRAARDAGRGFVVQCATGSEVHDQFQPSSAGQDLRRAFSRAEAVALARVTGTAT
jgi:anti-anti-sigma regulatory factor